jgi:hypothetical protein
MTTDWLHTPCNFVVGVEYTPFAIGFDVENECTAFHLAFWVVGRGLYDPSAG